MAANGIMRARFVRRALPLAAFLVLSLGTLSACGSASGPTTPVPDKNADVAVMNEILGRQLAVVEAYPAALAELRGKALAEARRFRGQEQEHVDATTKALRGLGGEADPPAETIEAGELKRGVDALEFLYEMENATIDAELNAITKLTGDWPRSLLATMVANQAERLVLIRRALGANRDETIPFAFENGETPAP
jgi:hypothetical protein